ncbi:Six-hairpin glycosidase-like protein [Boeremia exigua]|uniref:Six-hairpin glycosidase-like protein n=1 Tax=Boeremia exigua TaxID=749465 RepID=UPI001E8ED25D|nr:Six-hairpin glycosidase-like protein [Boeremia exigua]KAH6644856.1 Six-hairpin glycosidase-like protein [Boeremia exigua]
MRPALLTTTLAALTTAHSTHNAPNNAHNTTLPLSLQMAHSIIHRRDGIYTPGADSSGPLQAGIVQKAFTQLLTHYATHPSAPQLSSYITASADSLLPLFSTPVTNRNFSMDRFSPALTYLRLATSTNDTRYDTALGVLKHSLDANDRAPDGALWYYVYPSWAYLDGMYSLGPFAAAYTRRHDPGNASAWADLGRQFGLLAEHCTVLAGEEGEGMLVHGYDARGTAVWAGERGQSPHVWGRSLGWYVLGLLETLVELDEGGCDEGGPDKGGSDEGSSGVLAAEAQTLRDELAARFCSIMAAVVIAADPTTGAWPLLPSSPHTPENYLESSGTAMFTWALLAGVRRGYLSDQSYVAAATRAYSYLVGTFVRNAGNGTLGWGGTVGVCSLNSSASYGYYTGRPLVADSVLGSAAFVGASLEVEMLG